ncbi:MAG: hypothetical protein V8R27_02945 [Oscillospiraceae bacterium]
MRKIEKRTVICMALAILLAAGMAVFLIKYFAEGGKWASSAFNRHLYDSKWNPDFRQSAGPGWGCTQRCGGRQAHLL